MKITILGSGTSHGIPVIGCSCEVCASTDRRDKRTRASILVTDEQTSLLVDTATDFRTQALREGITSLDAILYTHAHADHLMGLDDTRTLSRHRPLPVYSSADTVEEIRRRFDYVFKETQVGGGKPNLSLRILNRGTIRIGTIDVTPVPIMHGNMSILGYRFGEAAYLTDCSFIPDESYALLAGVRTLIIGALRYRAHPTHFSVSQALAASEQIGASRIVLTHMCHDLGHASLAAEVAPRAEPAYDGMSLSID